MYTLGNANKGREIPTHVLTNDCYSDRMLHDGSVQMARLKIIGDMGIQYNRHPIMRDTMNEIGMLNVRSSVKLS